MPFFVLAVLTRSRSVPADMVPVAVYPPIKIGFTWLRSGTCCLRARGVVPAAPVIADWVPVASTRVNLV